MPLQFLVYIHRFKVKQQSRHQCVIISRQRLQLWVLEDMALRPLWWNMQLQRRNTEEWLEQSWLLPDKKGQSNLRVTVDPCGCKALKLFTLNYQGACIMDWLPDSSVRCVSLPSASVSTTPSKWFTNKHSTVLLFVIQSSVWKLIMLITFQVDEMVIIARMQILALLWEYALVSLRVDWPSSLPSRPTLSKSECKQKLVHLTELDDTLELWMLIQLLLVKKESPACGKVYTQETY